MTNVLSQICDQKRQHIAAAKQKISERELLERCKQQTLPRGFTRALQHKMAAGQVGLIAEVKKASPSKGIIREDFSPAAIAKAYEQGGAACISVLTDVPYFQGHDDYLIEARSAIKLPVLRKDFMLEPYQIIESRALGADCILLIMAELSDVQAAELESTAHELGMNVLIEIHDQEELQRALNLKSKLIGINNRNLKTLDVNLQTTEQLVPLIPKDKLVICESGIFTHADILRMQAVGVHSFLVGESLMRQADITKATQELLGM